MRLAISCFVLLFSMMSVMAQQFRFQHLGIEEGLNNNKVFMTVEDDDGYIWISTQGGIGKYDGRNLRFFPLESIEGVQLRRHVNTLLNIDSNGKVWLVLNNGLVFYYDSGLERFVYHDQIMTDLEGEFSVSEFHIDHKDQFVIGSFSSAYLYDPSSRSVTKISEIESTVKSIVQSADSIYFISSRNGIYVYDEHFNFLYNLKNKEIEGQWIPNGQKIESLYLQESENKLWIGSEKSGLYNYDLTHHELSLPDDLRGNMDLHIRSITDFGGGKLMVGTDGGGIFIYDTFTSKVLDQLVVDENNEYGLSSNAIYDIFISSQGVVFISTFRGGVNIYNPQRQNISSIKHIKGNENSLKNNVVLSITEPKRGWISFGTDMGISLLDKSTDEWDHLSLDPMSDDRNKSEVAWSQSVDSNGNLWVASFIYSLNQLEKLPDGNYRHKRPDYEFINNARIKTIYHHTNDALLLGSINAGLFTYEQSGELKNYPIQEAYDIEPYFSDKVIIASREGMAILDLEHEEVIWLNDDIFGDSTLHPVTSSCLVDKDRNLWVGTSNKGLYVFDINNKSVRAITSDDGLASNIVFDMISDAYGNIWVATSLGLSKIDGDVISNLYKSDGLISTDFNRNTAIRDDEGNLYFGTNRGAITFDPSSIELPSIKKKLLLSDFYLNHERIVPSKRAVLAQSLNNTKYLSLDHQQNSFSIGFSSIDFVHPERGTYSWKLDGYDQDWINSSNQEKATYTNVLPGQYTFRLRLVDQLGNLLAPERAIQLDIEESIWKTGWAYLLYFILALSLLVLSLYSYRLFVISKSSEERLHFLMEMAHEIKTPLTLIRAPITDLLKNSKTDDQMKESLGVALRNADKLHKQMMQFLDFKSINVRKPSLQIESVDLIQLVNNKLYAFKVLAAKKNITLTFNHLPKTFIVKSDEKVIDKIASNLISNAIKYTPIGGSVALTLSATSKSWELSVKDNGIGITKEDRKKIFTLFYRTENARNTGITGSGVGLVLARDLANTLDGSVFLKDSSKEGSEFVIKMPLTQIIEAKEFVKEKELETQRIEEEELNNDKVKILFVEDDEELRRYQKNKFGDKYHVLTAANGADALELVGATLPNLIISDVNMPSMNGFQLCMNIKSNVATSHIPFILLTGMESKEHIQQGFESGADDYISKPFDFEILVTKIENLLSTRAAYKDIFLASDEDFEYKNLSNKLDQEFIDQITQLVDEHISNSDFSIIDLCHTMGMSRTAFYHKLKSLLNVSPSDFIRTIRLKRAKKLLLHPTNSISEVAYSTGFSDAKYFSTVYKKYFGQSPSQYVSDHKESRENK